MTDASGKPDPRKEEDEDDWCASAKKRTENGSDGLWLRCGPAPSDSWLSHWFSVRLNPCVSAGALIMLFSVIIFCMAFQRDSYCLTTKQVEVTISGAPVNTDVYISGPDSNGMTKYTRTSLEESDCYVPNIEFRHWQAWVTKCFTWMYIITQDVWIVFLFGICFTKYGRLKMGKDDDEPEFSFPWWFAMIFCCGVATGLFFFGVAEPIYHYEPCYGSPWAGPGSACRSTGNRYSQLPANERAQAAMNMTWYQWGLHGWVCYAIVAVLLGILHFRKGLPMTIKTCFYPLVGERIYSFVGDFIDAVSVVATTYGVCVSLGIGVTQINSGLKRLNAGQFWLGIAYFGNDNKDEWMDADSIEFYKSIWNRYPTTWKNANLFGNASSGYNVDTLSVVAGHIKDIDAQIFLIWMITLIATFSVMSGLKRGIAHFSMLAWILGMFLCWFILAFDDTWYLCNLFVQSIGYYIWDLPKLGFYAGAFDQPEHSGPDGYQESATWMDNWTIWYWGWWIAWAPFVGVFLARISKGRTIREFVFTVMVIAVAYNFMWMTIWGGAGLKMEMAAEKYGISSCSANEVTKNICRAVSNGADRYGGQTEYFCSSLTRLSCKGGSEMLFDVVAQYADCARILTVISIITITMYFVTSSDSGSMVDDIITANGLLDPPLIQRLWWSFTEGLAATGLMYAGRYIDPSQPMAGIYAMRALSLVVGLPYTFLVCFMCLALWRTLLFEFGERKWGTGFRSSILDLGITMYSAAPVKDRLVNFAPGWIDGMRLGSFAKFMFVPFLGLLPALAKLDDKKKRPLTFVPLVSAVVVAILLFYIGWLLIFLDPIQIKEGGYITVGNWTTDASSGFRGRLEDVKMSTRYGYFYKYSNTWENDQTLVQGTNNFHPDHFEAEAMGDRSGPPMHLAVWGFFLYFVFTVFVASVRASTRVLCNIPGTFLEDCFCTLFFYPSVLIQVNEALEDCKEPKENVRSAYAAPQSDVIVI